MKDYVPVKDVAKIIGLDRSHARKYIMKLGIPMDKRRCEKTNQLILTVTKGHAEKIIEARKQNGFNHGGEIVDIESGVFYVIMLIPEYSENRIKLGFTNDITERLSSHRTSAPTAKVKKMWTCKRSWEKTVIDVVTLNCDCKHILNEVYDFSDIGECVLFLDTLFEVFNKKLTS